MTTEDRVLKVCLISDSTGDTVQAAIDAVSSQYDQFEFDLSLNRFVMDAGRLDGVIKSLEEGYDLVLYTLANSSHRRILQTACEALNIRSIALLTPIFSAVQDMTGEQPNSKPGSQYTVNKKYLDRVSAVDYAISHDDGLTQDYLDQADVILLGVSRTSKTPTCIYLAYKGLRAANIPLVPGQGLNPLVSAAIKSGIPAVGLIASATRLAQVRQNRLLALGQPELDAYADRQSIEEELTQARLLFESLKLPIIDVTRRSIEETAAAIKDLIGKAGVRTDD